MTNFHDTGYGKRFFEYQLPRLCDGLETLGKVVHDLKKEIHLQSESYSMKEIVDAFQTMYMHQDDVRDSIMETFVNELKKRRREQ